MKKLYFFILSLATISAFAQTYNYTIYDNINSGIAGNSINGITVDPSGLVWIATYSGVSAFNGTTFTNYTTANSGITSNTITKIEIDGLGRKWMASQDNGISVFNGTSWTNYTTTNSGLPTNTIYDIAVDGLNNLWVATYEGLTKFNGTSWTTYNGVASVNAVATDSSNGVWVINDANVLYKFSGTSFTVIYQGVQDILDIANNILYISGSDSLMTFSTTGAFMANYYQSNSCLAGYMVNALDVSSTNKAWLAFQGDGVQNFTDCVSYTQENSDLPDDYYNVIRTEASGSIWLGHSQMGLVKMTPSTTSCTAPSVFSSSNVSATSATITWNATGSPTTNYLFVYNTEPTIGGIDGNTAATSAGLTELSPNTDYHWWVASVCGASQSQTDWVYGGSFTTLPSTSSGCFKEISSGQQFTVAIKEDGTLWSWGANAYGQLGYPTSANINVPTQIGTGAAWKSVSCGTAHTIALKTDGTMWAWGNNFYGYLGDGTTTSRNTPVQIGIASDWKEVAAGSTHNVAVKNNGTLWAWGYNSHGQLGTGNTTNKTVPTQIGTATNWQTAGAGNTHSFAIKTDGTLWAWGRNNSGQLGDGTLVNKSTAVQIGTDTDWQMIDGGTEFTAAIKTTGTLWTWGNNISGQLGHNDDVNRSVPTKVGTATTWEFVAAGTAHVVASRNYGALFAWGNNGYGQVGNGTTMNVSAPALLFNESEWLAVNAGFDFSTAMSGTGTVFTWGNNSLGQLGNNTFTNDYDAYGSLNCPGAPLTVDDEINIESLTVYPNPVSDKLNLSFGGIITGVSVYNVLGQQIMTKTDNVNQDTLDFASLSAGTYFVKISSGQLSKTIKIIKQ